MKFSENWLRQFVDPPLTSEELAHALTMAGLEVEALESAAPPFTKVVVGEVLSVDRTQWWGPTGFTCPLAEMDFREGGTSLVCMRAPKEFGGQDMYNTLTYEEIVPMKRLVYILRFTDKEGKAFDPAEMGLPAGIQKEVRNVNVFKGLGNGKTELTITEYGYTTDEPGTLSKAGLEQCLDKMAESLKYLPGINNFDQSNSKE